MQDYLLNYDEDAETFDALKTYWKTLRLSSDSESGSYQRRIGFFRDILDVTPVFAYDLPELVKQYPQGFHTESTIFIAAPAFKKAIEYMDSPAHYFMIISAILDMVEDSYGKTFSEESRVEMVRQAITGNAESSVAGLEESKAVPRIGNITIAQLEEMAEKAGVTHRGYEEKLGVSTAPLNNVLFNLCETHNPQHPFHALAEEVVARQVASVMPQNSTPSIKEFSEYYGLGMSADSIAYAKIILSQAVDKSLANNGHPLTTGDLVANLKKDLLPYMVLINDSEFAYGLDVLKEKLAAKLPDPVERRTLWNVEFREEFAHTVMNTGEVGPGKRDILIRHITDFSAITTLKQDMEEMEEKKNKM